MKAKFVYEAMGDILKGKSDEEILSSLESGDLDPDYLLSKSITKSFLPGVKKALENGADVHANNDSALRYASENGHLSTVDLLLKNGADVHVYHDYPLRWASVRGHLDIVELLFKNGADVHAIDAYTLWWASQNGHLDVVKLLKKYIETKVFTRSGKS
jgi:ankyrin repeat protein